MGIDVSVDLDATPSEKDEVATGVLLLDEVLREFRTTAGFALTVRCNGDRYIDDHHTAEDVSIALGQCLNKALGDKKGLVRMGCAQAESAAAKVRVVLDLSNRPDF